MGAALPLSAESAIFFEAGDVVFAAPDRELAALPPGAMVRIERGSGRRPVGRGEIFRVRPDRVTVRVLDGEGIKGDFVVPDDSDWVGDFEPVGADSPVALARRALLLPVFAAPTAVRDRFDREFAAALGADQNLFPGGNFPAGGGAIEVVSAETVPARTPPDPRTIGALAERHGASYVIVPVFVDSGAIGPGRIAVTVFDASGRKVGSVAQEARLFPEARYEEIGRRVGRLTVRGRFVNLLPAPTAIAVDSDGLPRVTVGAEVFALSEDGAVWVPEGRAFSPVEDATVAVGSARYRIRIDPPAAVSSAMQRVVVERGGDPLFVSAEYPRVTSLAVHGSKFYVLRDDTIEVLELPSAR